ncbi:MAG: DNA-directed RNA polymerase subunit alpha, partial [Parcubacteria group bacterium]|nr:DNA-directed RNA polymerase subunit alpha [Parcubacteria group bacterium]
RRVLLSSMQGAAVTALKLKGVLHEFSTIPHVKEDFIEILLNFKQLRIKSYSDQEVKLHLSVSGEKEVLAGDIEKSSDAEVMNKDLKLFTTTDKHAKVELELFVNKGLGYLPTENREKEKMEIGTIAIDAIFTPIRNVGYKVENVRVGQMTNYERLVLEVETDGTIEPMEAIMKSSEILLGHFGLFSKEKLEELKDKK